MKKSNNNCISLCYITDTEDIKTLLIQMLESPQKPDLKDTGVEVIKLPVPRVSGPDIE